ncbi:MAG: DNA-3-methyladenine glycosylase family protein [Anaerolineae bacterium]
MSTPAQPAPAYRFDLFYQIHARYPQPALFTLKDHRYYRAFADEAGTLALVSIHADAKGLHIIPLVGTIPEAHIQHVLGMHTDLIAFYAFAQQTPPLWSVVRDLAGLPLYRSETLYEALIFVIIEQHIAWRNAQRAQRLLVEWGGHSITAGGVTCYAMPTPQQLAQATLDDLKPLKITFQRMRLLIAIAERFADDPHTFTDVLHDAKALYERLLTIKGVGHWTASVVMARALGAYHYIPHNDVALQAAVATYFDVEKSSVATRTIFEEYGEFGGLASHFTLMRWVLDRYPVVNG